MPEGGENNEFRDVDEDIGDLRERIALARNLIQSRRDFVVQRGEEPVRDISPNSEVTSALNTLEATCIEAEKLANDPQGYLGSNAPNAEIARQAREMTARVNQEAETLRQLLGGFQE
jgi:hypothetical protein